jgi:hypothetical protein
VDEPVGYVERLIREAMDRGEFDNLPGRGRPLEDLDDTYDPAWWAKRYVQRQRALDDLGEVAREVRTFLDMVWMVPDEARVRSEVDALNRRLDEVNARLPHHERHPLLDPLEVVELWRRSRFRGAV